MESPESFPYDRESDELETSFVELLMRARNADYGEEQILSWEELVGKTRYMNDDELLLDALTPTHMAGNCANSPHPFKKPA